MGKKVVAAAAIAAVKLFNRKPGELPFRNPDRIPHMVNLMYAAWCLPENRDQRMGQLLLTAARLGGHEPNNIWNVEEEVFAKGFLMMINTAKDGDKT